MNVDDARDANELLAFALDARRRPGGDERYRDLLLRFRSDPAFARAVVALSEPLGLRVLAAEPLLGLIVDATEGSPFSPSLDGLRTSLRMNSTVEDRLIYGLILAGLAAWCYPTAASFGEPGLRHVRAMQVERKLRDLCERLRGEAAEGADGPAEMDYVWEVYARRKSHNVGKGGRLTHNCTLWMVGHTLRWLADQQFLIRDSSNPELYRATDRFRHHVNAAASRVAYRLIAAAVAEDRDVADAAQTEGAATLAKAEAREGRSPEESL